MDFMRTASPDGSGVSEMMVTSLRALPQQAAQQGEVGVLGLQ